MRTSLFLSSLFAFTLVSGAALAEKATSTPVRLPRAIEKLRAHGEVVDKVRGASARPGARPQDVQASPDRAQAPKNPRDRGESRILCSEFDVKCGKGPSRAHDNNAVKAESGDKGDRSVRQPAFLDKVLGSDRMHCNEAEECSMSLRAAKRAWSRAGQDKTQGDDPVSAAAPEKQVEKIRTRRAETTDRMACNDAGECMMSSKAAKKIWAYEAVKAGSFQGPGDAAKTPAQVAIENAKKK